MKIDEAIKFLEDYNKTTEGELHSAINSVLAVAVFFNDVIQKFGKIRKERKW